MGIKISALATESTPTGAALLPLVQGGVTKKATLTSLLALASGAVPPLSNVHFVDQGSGVSSGNDGSIGKPWLTAADALAALPPDSTPHTILLTPADYSGEGALSTPGGFSGLVTLVGLALDPDATMLGNITTAPSIILEGISALGVTAGSQLFTRDCVLQGIEAYNIDLRSTKINDSTCDGGSFVSQSSTFNGAIASAGTSIIFRDATFTGGAVGITFTGDPGIVEMDESSYRSALDAGGLTITNGTLAFNENLAQVTPATTNENYDFGDPVAWAKARSASLYKTTNFTIGGLVAPGIHDPHVKDIFFWLDAGSGTVTIACEDTGSAAANRILTGTGVDIIVVNVGVTGPYGVRRFQYSRDLQRWLMSKSQFPN
jgi:hypothetical protein